MFLLSSMTEETNFHFVSCVLLKRCGRDVGRRQRHSGGDVLNFAARDPQQSGRVDGDNHVTLRGRAPPARPTRALLPVPLAFPSSPPKLRSFQQRASKSGQRGSGDSAGGLSPAGQRRVKPSIRDAALRQRRCVIPKISASYEGSRPLVLRIL